MVIKMAKMWAGRSSGKTDKIADDFNSSISFDSRMYSQDIKGSIAHAEMLAKKGIISNADKETLVSALITILEDIESGKLEFSPDAEDIHMFVEEVLTERVGSVGKKLHTARSRNDQVALDVRLYLMDETNEIISMIKGLVKALCQKADDNKLTIMSGYTHLQRAQPVSFGHHLMAYAMMLTRDVERLSDAYKRMNISPIGCCALAGTTYNTDRYFEAERLGFADIAMNSIDGVSDRDFCLEFISAASIIMMHLSRLSEELVLYSSWEFGFIELSDSYTTGSSIMPQKKNPDMAELIRGKTGRVYGDLMALLTTLKGLPLAYNKDMQEDKESLFDAVDTVKACLSVMTPMIETMTVKGERMKKAAQEGFINATDIADYLAKKGLPFREAYKISGSLVAKAIEMGSVLESLPIEVYKSFSPLFEEDIYKEIDIEYCMLKRTSAGGPTPESVTAQIKYVEGKLF